MHLGPLWYSSRASFGHMHRNSIAGCLGIKKPDWFPTFTLPPAMKECCPCSISSPAGATTWIFHISHSAFWLVSNRCCFHINSVSLHLFVGELSSLMLRGINDQWLLLLISLMWVGLVCVCVCACVPFFCYDRITFFLCFHGFSCPPLFCFFFLFLFFSELGTEPRALCLLGKRSTTELNPQPLLSSFGLEFSY